MRKLLIVLIIQCGCLISANAQLMEEEFESFRNLFIPTIIKDGKVKTCTIKYFDVDEGEKSKIEFWEILEFNNQGILINDKMCYDEKGEDVDEIIFDYNSNGTLNKVLFYEGGVKDPFDEYYRMYKYDNDLLLSISEYWVDFDEITMTGTGEGDFEGGIYFGYDEQKQLLTENDSLNTEYFIYRRENNYTYKFYIESSHQNPSIATKADWHYLKYKNRLLMADVYELNTGSMYSYLADGRIKQVNELEEGKVLAVYTIQYKKKLPAKVIYSDKEEKKYKEYYTFEYSYF